MKNEMPRVRAAGLVIKNNKILLVKHTKDNKSYYLLPGGGVDKGEKTSNALKREFIEETGLIAQTNELLFVTESIEPSTLRHIIQLVFSCTVNGEIQKSQDERVETALFMDYNEFKEVTFYPDIKDKILDGWKNNSFNSLELTELEWK